MALQFCNDHLLEEHGHTCHIFVGYFPTINHELHDVKAIETAEIDNMR
ncbi:MAG: hypothetical protein ACJ0AN_07210 [Alphaproteobacteria bacterium]